MILVFGGAYSGKMSWVKKEFNINNEDICNCSDANIDFSKKVIYNLHKFTYYATINSINPINILEENKELLKDKIIICDEISSGIVPLKKEEREWRENTGKCLQYLSENSSKIYRIFCGIETVIKDV